MPKLDFPSFDDFLAEMGQDRCVGWSETAQREVQREIGFSFDLSNPDDARRFVLALHSLNHRSTVLMLRDYHEWLCKLLAERSLRLL